MFFLDPLFYHLAQTGTEAVLRHKASSINQIGKLSRHAKACVGIEASLGVASLPAACQMWFQKLVNSERHKTLSKIHVPRSKYARLVIITGLVAQLPHYRSLDVYMCILQPVRAD